MHLSDFVFFAITLSALALLTLISAWDHINHYANWEEKIHTSISTRLNENKRIMLKTFNIDKLRKPKPVIREICYCKQWSVWNDNNINMPACCREYYISSFISLSKYLKDNNVSYSLSNGTLLGALRCGEMINYDYNIDIVIYADKLDAKHVLNLWHRKSDIWDNMTIMIEGLPWSKTKFSGSHQVVLYYNIEVSPDKPKLLPCLFEGVLSSCRKDSRSLLKKRYGKDWMIPRRWSNSSAVSLNKKIDMKQLNLCIDKRLKMNDKCEKIPDLLFGKDGCVRFNGTVNSSRS